MSHDTCRMTEVIMFGLMGRKKGMTQIFNDQGDAVPVTVIEAGPCVVTAKKLKVKDGYNALQLGFGQVKESRLNKPKKGLFKKGKLNACRYLKEFRTENADQFDVGDVIDLNQVEVGDVFQVTGTTIGRGFSGVMRRHGKHGGPDSHGSHFHRTPGSIGMCAWPGRVIKNMKLPGHYGVDRVTTKNLKIVKVFPDDNILLIKGAVPGHKNAQVFLKTGTKDFVKKEDVKGKEEV